MGEDETNKQIDAAFSVWQSVCGLKFERVEPNEECKIKIPFSTDPNTADKISCPYKLNVEKKRNLGHAFYPGKNSICGDIYFDNETFINQKQNRVMGNKIYFL